MSTSALCVRRIPRKIGRVGQSNASYKYPPANGFVVNTGGAPILGNATLPVGQKLDRFGSEYGNFLTPLGAPFIERALPPTNLITHDGNHPFNYHVYEVAKSFVVGLGPIAPCLSSPDGYLRRLTPDEYDEPREYSDDYTPGPARVKRH